MLLYYRTISSFRLTEVYRSLCQPDGQPGFSLRLLNNALLAYLYVSMLFCVIFAAVISRFWGKIDQKLCPGSGTCYGPCLVDADPDIAGIGVSMIELSKSPGLRQLCVLTLLRCE